jgi:hypothetical protein
MRTKCPKIGGWFWCVGAGLALQAQAFPLQGEKSLIAETQDGQHTRVGRVVFTPTTPGNASIRVHMDHAVMRDHFLSMREFKCLAAPQEVTCHVPYPYTNPATVSVQNLHWLDHHLLFLYKKPADFGAKLWNGIIYRWRLTPQGLEGLPHAVDLNLISAPPDRLDVPPFSPAESEPFAPEARWIQRMRIE